jgi:hypothetical protein
MAKVVICQLFVVDGQVHVWFVLEKWYQIGFLCKYFVFPLSLPFYSSTYAPFQQLAKVATLIS